MKYLKKLRLAVHLVTAFASLFLPSCAFFANASGTPDYIPSFKSAINNGVYAEFTQKGDHNQWGAIYTITIHNDSDSAITSWKVTVPALNGKTTNGSDNAWADLELKNNGTELIYSKNFSIKAHYAQEFTGTWISTSVLDISKVTIEYNVNGQSSGGTDNGAKDSAGTDKPNSGTGDYISQNPPDDAHDDKSSSDGTEEPLVYAEFRMTGDTNTYGAVYTLYIHNSSDYPVTDWQVSLTALPGKSLKSSDNAWNDLSMEQNGSKFIFSSKGTNTTVNANSVSSLDGAWISADTADFSKVIITCTLNGRPYSSTTSSPVSGGNSSADNSGSSDCDGELPDITGNAPAIPDSKTPVALHGKLSVNGTSLVDKNGMKFALHGVSSHGIAWFPEYMNKECFKNMRDEWGVNSVRIAMYTEEYNGYCSGGNRDSLKKLVKDSVKYATELGMYVIIDWHILSDGSPETHQSDAIEFFNEMSGTFSKYDNVIYELCNEPNGGTKWETIKAYAEKVIPVIKKNNSDAIIIVGTPSWSQDVDVASSKPITGYTNIMYSIHFYSGTHRDSFRDKVRTALRNGAPIFCTEYGISAADGNGGIYTDEANKWLDFFDENNISYFCWSLSNKNESSALIRTSSSKYSGFTNDDLSAAGKWLVTQYNKRKK